MKKRLVFLYVIAVVLIISITFLIQNKREEEKKEAEAEEIVFESNKTIQLFRKETGDIQAIDLNYYLLCVTASEIPFWYDYEAIKAQVIVARTYMYNKMQKQGEECGDVCDNFAHCQAFNDIEKLEEIWRGKGYTDNEIKEGEEKIKRAVVESEGMVITYGGEIINALFHASSPQKTEDAKAIWTNEDVPYLKSVENVEDESYENRNSIVEKSYLDFKNTLIENGYITQLDRSGFQNIRVNEYTESGRVKNISVGSNYIKAEALRTMFGLKSTNFTMSLEGENVIFKVIGYGHGVGMSQVGANTYAKEGRKYDEIIKHYYTGVEIARI